MTERYFLDRDNDMHWYIIPVSKEKEWDLWVNLDSDDERAWCVPDYATPTGGSFRLVTFTDPQMDG